MKPILISKFERLKKHDVAGGLAMDCDYMEGTFSRAEDWSFEIYLDDKPMTEHFRTRITELYLKAGGVPQWWWEASDDQDKRPEWHYGWLIFQDLMHGISDINQLKSDDHKLLYLEG